jgi:hypothetical protein
MTMFVENEEEVEVDVVRVAGFLVTRDQKKLKKCIRSKLSPE